MNLLGFGSRPVDIIFTLKEQQPARQVKQLKFDGQIRNLPIYYDHEDVVGKVYINFKKPGSRLDHHGIRIEFIGHVESVTDRSNLHEFVALSKLLAYPGELSADTAIDFAFIDAEKPYESYYGTNVKLRCTFEINISIIY
ncbi:hypothetical protein GJ496_006423 [Pomphorhynchus laevis]|nr:hypothetical protein GJ496_006423 [Pomphorhynchus laevis]